MEGLRSSKYNLYLKFTCLAYIICFSFSLKWPLGWFKTVGLDNITLPSCLGFSLSFLGLNWHLQSKVNLGTIRIWCGPRQCLLECLYSNEQKIYNKKITRLQNGVRVHIFVCRGIKLFLPKDWFRFFQKLNCQNLSF